MATQMDSASRMSTWPSEAYEKPDVGDTVENAFFCEMYGVWGLGVVLPPQSVWVECASVSVPLALIHRVFGDGRCLSVWVCMGCHRERGVSSVPVQYIVV